MIKSKLKARQVPELTEVDKNGAAISLIRLQVTYKIPTENMTLGDIYGMISLYVSFLNIHFISSYSVTLY